MSWTKNVVIMQRCKDSVQGEFYLKVTRKFGWTKDVLINQRADAEGEAPQEEQAGKEIAAAESMRVRSPRGIDISP